MRIALLHFSSPPVAGGVEHVLKQQAETLIRNGSEVVIISGRGRPFGGIPYLQIPLLSSTHPTIRALSARLGRGECTPSFERTSSELREQLAGALDGYDVTIAHNALSLHFNLPLTAALVDLARTKLSGKLVSWSHDLAWVNPLYAAELHAGYPWSLIRTPQQGVHYVAISYTRANEARKMWRQADVSSAPEIMTIPNGIDPCETLQIAASIQRTLGAHLIAEASPIVLAPVRITRRKRLELAIEAVAKLVKRGQQPALLVTGPVWGHHPIRSRSYLDELSKRAEELGVRDRVRFIAAELGRALRSRELTSLYALSSVVILTSESEGFGLPLLEAGLQRIPVVARDLPVFRELGSDSVYLFPEGGGSCDIADCIEVASASFPLRTRVLRDYSWDAIYRNQMTALFASIGVRR